MSGGFEAGAVAAIDAVQGQDKSGHTDAIRVAQQIQGAQSFEASLERMSQVSPNGAASCQQGELNCKKTALASNAPAQVQEAAMYRPDSASNLGQSLLSYMDKYSEKARNYSAELNSAFSGNAQAPAGAAGAGNPAPINPTDALKLMAKTFEFSIETHLITNISSTSSNIFNSLMKEQ